MIGKKNKKPNSIIFLLVAIVIIVSIITWLVSTLGKSNRIIENVVKESTDLVTFSSEEEFRTYLLNSKRLLEEKGSILRFILGWPELGSVSITSTLGEELGEEPSVYRYSPTNVVVFGIDEPDIVKTDGRTIYYSNYPKFYYLYDSEFYEQKNIMIINAFPVENLKILSRINETGNLLLHENVLIIIDNKIYGKITGYDVSDRENPKKLWEYKFADNFNIIDARLYEGKLYLLAFYFIDIDSISYDENISCPIKILHNQKKEVLLKCNEIYRFKNESIENPSIIADTIAIIMIVDPKSGEINNKKAVISSLLYSSLYGFISYPIYMSKEHVYISVPRYIEIEQIGKKFEEKVLQLLIDFIIYNCTDLFPKSVIDKIKTINQTEEHFVAKSEKISFVIQEYLNSLPEEQRNIIGEKLYQRSKKFEEDIKIILDDFAFIKTKIIKFDLNLNPIAIGEVPGYVPNPFSMDEYKGYLRVATTVPVIIKEEDITTINAVYILDSKLSIVGSVKGLAHGEEIYGVRFIGDLGYVVTFRTVDPLFVINLSDPKNPKVEGELKIPGYSSYLHPINDTLLLGIGMEGIYLKISLFNVSSAKNPIEVDKYILRGEFSSEVLYNHRAFLIDPKHQIFFLPAFKKGYIFSYKDNRLSLLKSIDLLGTAVRALYINDYLYIICEDGIVVIDERTWDIVKIIYY